jgi:Zn-dependent protease/CBS domain-containing protein
MFGARWRLFRLLGIPVSLDLSWLIILALLTLTLAELFPQLMRQYYPEAVVSYPPGAYWGMAVVTAVLFFACILLHEFGHALVARHQGMPIRGITLFLFGGVAEIGEEPTSAGREFLMAVAGPVVSLILAGLFALLAWIGRQSAWPPIVVIMLGYLASINLLILVFNLVPAFPLDGGRVLRSILWGATGSLTRATRWASLAGQVFAWLLIAWGVVQFFSGNWIGGVWLGLIGMFLNSAAQSGYQQVMIRQALRGESVQRFMNPNPIVVPPSLDLRTWIEDYVYHYHRKTFPVGSSDHIEGVIDASLLTQLPRSEWPLHTVGEVMTRDWQTRSISPDTDAMDAFAKMTRTGASRLLVTEDGRLVGILSLKDLLRFLNLKLEFEGEKGIS